MKISFINRTVRRTGRKLFALLFGATVGLSIQVARGEVLRQWISPNGGQYSEAGNWIPATRPGPLDTAIFDWSTPTLKQIEFGDNLKAKAFQLVDGDVAFSNLSDRHVNYEVQTGKIERNGQLRLRGDTRNINLLGESLESEGQITLEHNSSLLLNELIVNGTPADPNSRSVTSNGKSVLGVSTMELGQKEGSIGTASVSGAEANWGISDRLHVGHRGHGELRIENGARVNSGSSGVASGTGAKGIVDVVGVGQDGIPSTWATESVNIGGVGDAQLNVSGGAVATHLSTALHTSGLTEVHITGTSESGLPSTWTTGPVDTSDFGGHTALRFDAGAVVNSGDVYFRRNVDANVQGTDSAGNPTTWNAANLRMIGSDLDIRDGGSVTSDKVTLSTLSSAYIQGTAENPSTWHVNSLLDISTNADVQSSFGQLVTETTQLRALDESSNSYLRITDTSWANSGDVFVGGNHENPEAGRDSLVNINGSDSNVEIGGRLKIWDAGEVRLADGFLGVNTVDHTAGGALELQGGTLQVERFDGDLINQATTLSPGPNAGLTTVVGDLTQLADAGIALDIGGDAPGASHDLINVTQSASLDGMLQLSLTGGFTPNPADTYMVLAADSLLGAFDNVPPGTRLETLDGRGSFLVNYGVGSLFDENRIVLSDFLSLAGLIGDFNNDGLLDATDIDLLSAAVAGGELAFDLTSDGLVNESDRKFWVEDLKNTYFGDSNLDGEFNSSDFVQVFQRGEYEDTIAGNSTWAEGDWNGDGDFNSGDFVLAFQSGGYEMGPRASIAAAVQNVAAVPEPTGVLLTLIGAVALLGLRRK